MMPPEALYIIFIRIMAVVMGGCGISMIVIAIKMWRMSNA